MKRLATAVLVLLGAMNTASAAGDAAAGQEKAAVCAGCHGADGNSVVPTFPKLAGQHAQYIEKQLLDFKGNKRKDPIMNGQVVALNEQDIQNLAAFYASQTAKPGVGTPAEAGKALYEGGNIASGVTACKGCHGPAGSGNPDANFPAVKGQHVAYLTKALNDFRSGARSNDMNGMMSDVARRMTDAEIKAVAEYIAGL